MDNLAWMSAGECKTDPDLFYPEQGQRYTEEARTICDTCTVKVDCLEYALAHMGINAPRADKPIDVGHFGMWGGTTPEERKRILLFGTAPMRIPAQRNKRAAVAA